MDQPHSHASEVASAERFEFGRNWKRFLRKLDEPRIRTAEQSLREMLDVQDLKGKRFLDIGCGSGLFSLAARRLGATVHSFDYDPDSVACAMYLRDRFFPGDEQWTIEEGSALDPEYLRGLGSFDVVYAWGVLHHTGSMWPALENATIPVAPGGKLFIAIYNDCGEESERWVRIKKRYCELPAPLKPVYAAAAMAPYEAREAVGSLLRGRPSAYIHSWTRYSGRRGMSRWRDIIDWVGGYPYEYASTEAMVDFFRKLGLEPVKTLPTGGLGCNELVLEKQA
ncbi:MAG TPA: class I SAM-dependent methyltransferase [Longimicrobiales bacterium]|nr:class I SAM-dependent methyltransferase [Longimicrobiales bacterium]